MDSTLELVALIGALEIAGYLLYIYKSLKKEVEPNPAAWLMFGYGAIVMTILEWDRNASFLVLLQPLACAFFNLVIVAIVWHRGKLAFPDDLFDQVALISDILITVAFVVVKVVGLQSLISSQTQGDLVLLFLILSNLSLIICYIPLIRNVHKYPGHENFLPWIVWGASYAVLLAVTIYQYGFWHELVIYPFISLIIHVVVIILSLRDEVEYDEAHAV